MWTSLPYLVEAQICFALLWLFYRFVLQRDGNFARSRAYLLGMVPVSLTIPLLSIPVLPAQPSLPLITYLETAGPLPLPAAVPLPADPAEMLHLWIIGAAAMGSALLMLFYLAHTLRWVRISRGSVASRQLDHVRVVYNPSVKGTCSLFNCIFVNRNDLNEGDLNQLMAHELCHVRLRHSWDRLLAALLTVLCWWNPFVWLWHRSLREVHEYQADDAVLRHGFDAEGYIMLMVSELTRSHSELASGFSYSLVRNRLQMLSRSGSRRGGVRLLLALPVVAGLLALFSFTERSGGADLSGSISAALGDAEPSGTAKSSSGANEQSFFAPFGSVSERLNSLNVNNSSPVMLRGPLGDSLTVVVDGKVDPRGTKVLDQLNANEVHSITVSKLKGQIPAIYITTKAFEQRHPGKAPYSYPGPEAKASQAAYHPDSPGAQGGNNRPAAKEAMANRFGEPIRIGLGSPKEVKIERLSAEPLKVELDGVALLSGERELEKLDPQTILSITVMKNENKIVVTTKAAPKRYSASLKRVIIDGRIDPRGERALEELGPDANTRMAVVKSGADTSVVAWTKASPDTPVQRMTLDEKRLSQSSGQLTPEKKPVTVKVDGKVDPRGDKALKELDPANIAEIEVSKTEKEHKVVVWTKAVATLQ